jgi:hypothetical protein
MLGKLTIKERLDLHKILSLREADGQPLKVSPAFRSLAESRVQIKEALELVAADKTWNQMITQKQFERLQNIVLASYGQKLVNTTRKLELLKVKPMKEDS